MLFESPRLRLATEYRIATLILDVADSECNVLTRAVLTDLDRALRVAQGHPALDVLVFRSGKASGFGVGPDPAELGALADPAEAADLARLGQRVALRLAALAPVTVAFLDGPCLGGALELALACDWRMAVGGPGTRLGFPQVRHAAIPCWGGTVRLPRLVGLKAALDLFLNGAKLSAAQALAAGLVDYAVGPRLATVHLDRLVLDLQESGAKRPRQPRLVDRLPGHGWWLFRQAARLVRRLVSEDHAAPRELLAVLKAGQYGGPAEGLAAERAAMTRLAKQAVGWWGGKVVKQLPVTPRPESSRGALGASAPLEDSGRGETSSFLHPAAPLPIRRVGVIGGGTVGAALAQWAALRGCVVAVRERDATSAARARVRLAAQFRRAVAKRLIPADEAPDRLAAISCGPTWDGFADVDLVIEAVDEDRALKRQVLQEAERHVPPGALLATVTTAFTVQALQEGLARPGRLVGWHTGLPAEALKAAEVAAGPATDPAAVAQLRRWLRENGKATVLVADRPGRILGRVLLPYLHEAVLLAEDGVPVAEADAALRRFGLAWGPFEALDACGLDVVLAALRELTAAVGPDLTPPPLLEWLVGRGWRGRKSGAGFYRYGGSTPTVNFVLPRPSAGRKPQVALARCVGRLLNAALACPDSDAATVDGLLTAAGWPAYRGGPLHYVTTRGPARLLAELTELARRYGPRFAPGPELARRAGRPADRRGVA